MYGYEHKIKLFHNEIPAKINAETGEITEIQKQKRPNNIPENKEIHYPEGRFAKYYEEAMDYLLEVLKPVEYKIVGKMISMARMNSNSLRPLNDSTTTIELANTFSISRNRVTTIFRKLKDHGIYAEFNFAKAPLSFDPKDPSTFNDKGVPSVYWVLNPYISFKGKVIDTGIADLFREVKITKYILSKEN